MVNSLSKTIGYICPVCYSTTIAPIGIFKFSGNSGAELLCSDTRCRHKCGSLIPQGDKYKIVIDCPICTETHTFMLSQAAFWNTPLLTFQCPNSAIDIFFIGTKQKVSDAVDENNRMLNDLADSQGLDELEFFGSLFDLIENAAKTKRLVCRCGSNNVSPELSDDGVVLVCKKCGHSRLLNPESVLAEKIFDGIKTTF